MKSMYKSELAREMGISASTMTTYMHQVEHLLPHYSRSQTLLTPDQVRIVREFFCMD